MGRVCEKVTSSNVINVFVFVFFLGWGGGAGAKAFLLVTDNRRSWLDSPFCIITQHRKFEIGQSKKISNAEELTVALAAVVVEERF